MTQINVQDLFGKDDEQSLDMLNYMIHNGYTRAIPLANGTYYYN